MKKGSKKYHVFKFSIDEEKDSEIIHRLNSIRKKEHRGRWILNAVKLLNSIENQLKTTDIEEITSAIEECIKIRETKKLK
ncbi:MAG: hypothetical protein QXX12_04565 [Nanopusillaceae archaeon]